jgi:hypothetical protein
MSKNIPSNQEMYKRIILHQSKDKRDFDAHTFWKELYTYSKERNLVENNIDTRVKDNFHSCFWELYLPKALAAKGINLLKDNRGQKRPDFYFESDIGNIWIEAVACGEPKEPANIVPPPSDDFEGGIQNLKEPQIMQRLASAISSKIEQYNRIYSYKISGHYVIAVNGYRAFNGFPDGYLPSPMPPPIIVKTLYGMGTQFLTQNKGIVSKAIRTTEGNRAAPIAHFQKPANKDIAGVLYSSVDIWQTLTPLCNDFIFIQNPYAKDIASIFSFCSHRYRSTSKQ